MQLNTHHRPFNRKSSIISWIMALLLPIQITMGAAPYEPDQGIYLGVVHAGMEKADIGNFLDASSKDAATFGVYVDFSVGFNTTRFNEWVAEVKGQNPEAGIVVVIEPKGSAFPSFYQNWGPDNSSYQKTLEYAELFRNAEIPVFVVFAHEANGHWYDWSPAKSATDSIDAETYKTGWRNFSQLIREHAPNVAMVWSMNAEGSTDADDNLLVPRESIYPGDEYVDWVGMSMYNGFGFGNTRNEVIDYQARFQLHGGFWNQYCDFYRIFSDPNNPDGHKKPMMITETGSYAPVYNEMVDYPFIKNSTVAKFDTLDAAAQLDAEELDDGDSMSHGVVWGIWEAGKMALNRSAGRLVMKNLSGPREYIGGFNRSVTCPNWSACQNLTLRVAKSSGPDVLMKVLLKNQTGNTVTAETALTKRISSTSMQDLVFPKDEFAPVGGAFDWASVNVLQIELLNTEPSQTPADALIDSISMCYQGTADDDLQWDTPTGCDGAALSMWIAEDGVLKIIGTPNSASTLAYSAADLPNGNWSADDNICLSMKKARLSAPWLRVGVQSGDQHGSRIFHVDAREFQSYVIPIRSLAPSDSFDWGGVQRITLTVGGTAGEETGLHIDEISLGNYDTSSGSKIEMASEAVYAKENWLLQLYSPDGYTSDGITDRRPSAAAFRTEFPNIHMINYFNVAKYECGEFRNFRIAGYQSNPQVTEVYNELIADDYYLDDIVEALPPAILFTNSNIRSCGGTAQDKDPDQIELLDDGNTLHMWGNNWKTIDLPVTITPDTIVSFDFKSDGAQGEINGIGFANGAWLERDTFIQINGSQSWGLSRFNGMYSGDGWVHYDIPVGELFTGDFACIFFANDADAGQDTSVYYRNLRISTRDPEAPSVTFSEDTVITCDSRQDLDADQCDFLDNGHTLHLWGNNWKTVAGTFAITEDTVLAFDFRSDGATAEINGIGFSGGAWLSPSTFLKLHGTQNWGCLNFDGNYTEDGWMHYEIPVGQVFTGTFPNIIFANDADAGQNTDVQFRNIRIQ